VYFPDAGFVRFDPTPPSERGSVQESAWARMVLAWDALQQRWRSMVVDYDVISQAQGGAQAGSDPERDRPPAGRQGGPGGRLGPSPKAPWRR